MKTKNGELLNDFTKYCMNHPQERFWQALRNWSGFMFLYATNDRKERTDLKDTFYFEGKDK